jgi:hypothetical protein
MDSDYPDNSTVNDGLALKVFQDYCCNGCTCQSSKDHIIQEEFAMDEIDFE